MAADHPDLASLIEIMHRLRKPGGCPWDAEQTHESLRPYLIEEAYEVLEALDRGSDRELCDELGDVLLQVVFHAELASERDAFSIDDVARAISAKLVRRHPHVFSDVEVASSEEVKANWVRIKAEEERERSGSERRRSALDGIPRALPALMRAHRIGERAAHAGFDWPDPEGARDKVYEELDEVAEAVEAGSDEAVQAELGDLILAVASYCRLMGYNAETLLERGVATFERRFTAVEKEFSDQDRQLGDASAEELDASWRRAKRRLSDAAE